MIWAGEIGSIVDSRSYDGNGNIVSNTRNGVNIALSYDEGNRLVSRTIKGDSDSQISYKYDARDRLIEENNNGNTTSYNYDSQGNVSEVENSLGEKTKYEYDGLGNILKITDAANNEFAFTYTSFGKIKTKTNQDSKIEKWNYDRYGRLLEKEDRDGTIYEYSYNKQGNITHIRNKSLDKSLKYLFNQSNTPFVFISEHDITEYSFDKNGNIDSVLRNGSDYVDYSYNDNNMLSSIQYNDSRVSYDYYPNNMIKRVSKDDNTVADYSYEKGSVKEIEYANGSNILYNYNSKRMVEEEIYSHKGKELFRNSYDYDLSGNTIQKTIDGKEENYTYDGLNRIKTITGDNQNITYYYDELGNVTQKDFGDFQDVFLYNNLNQVTRKSSKDGVTNYEYDNRGNLVKETTEGKVTSYEYNGFDNLTKIQNESGYQINRYDLFGNRVNILHNGREKNRILNVSSMIAENNNKGNQMNEFIRGYNLLSTTQESTSYYMSSHRGDVYDIVSGDGETVNKYRYDVYGKIEEETENIYNPYKYAGYEQNLVGATYNLGVRTYNPEIGRFIQEDTYLGDGLNLYAYVSDNPLKYVDPSGYCKEVVTFSRTLKYSGIVDRELEFDFEIIVNDDYDEDAYIKRHKSAFPVMKGHELIAKTTINGETVELFGTPYVYSRDSKDIDIRFEEVGFFESTIESGFLLDNLKAIPQVNSALNTSVSLIDIYLETTDDTWENRVVQGDMKIEVESGAMGRNIMVKYYYGTDKNYNLNKIALKGYENPKRKDVRYGW